MLGICFKGTWADSNYRLRGVLVLQLEVQLQPTGKHEQKSRPHASAASRLGPSVDDVMGCGGKSGGNSPPKTHPESDLAAELELMSGSMVKRRFLLGRDVAEPELITDLEARRLWPYGADKVAVRNLSLVANAGFDIWGRMKEQPLQVSVTLALRSPFNSAAKDDKVDSSTVHYGTLSKTVLSAISKASSGGWLDDWTLGSVISAAIVEAVPETNKTLESSAIDVCFPKGSTLGTGTGASWKIFYRPPNQIDDERTLVKVAPCVYLRDVHVPTLIGVNSNEREKKQAVVLNVWIDHTGYFHYGKNHCDLESELVEVSFHASLDCRPLTNA